jgi:ABC-type multidrug transport system ATPase subunit
VDEILVARGLSYSYGAFPAVSGVDLTLERGDLLGFVGPNGAGKTTTIKMLLGLLTPAAGTIRAFGRSLAAERSAVLRRIGALVETPALYPQLTAGENLAIQRIAYDVDVRRIRDVLELAELAAARDRQVRTFSLGMRQRLGIAMALLHSPELLILDEPANGLDPQGIQDLRALLRRLAGAGTTLLVSSHILAELEQTVSSVAVIARGRLRYHGTIDAFKAGREARARVTVDDPEAAARALAAVGVAASSATGSVLTVAARDREARAAIVAALVGAGVKVYEATPELPNLEDAFLALVGADREEVGR